VLNEKKIRFKKMNNIKKVITSIASVLIFSIAGAGQAVADRTINIDLDNFQPDVTVNWPIQTFYGLVAGDVITVNVSNATGRIEGYVNNGVGSSITFSQGDYQITNLTNPSTTFDPAGSMTSIFNGTAKPIGTGIAVVTLGQNPLLDLTIPVEALYAAFSSDPANSLGLVAFYSGDTWKIVNFLVSGDPRRTGNALRVDSVGTTTEKNNVVSCTPGKYTFLNGGSTAEASKIQSYVYTLLVNGKAVSTLSSDNFKSVASHLFPTIAGNMAGTATLEGATWDLKGMSNYSASCQVYATQSGGNIQSVTTEAHDAVALAAAAEAAANVARDKEIISTWNAANEELAKKYRDQRLAVQP
jgi:hypothetical protein